MLWFKRQNFRLGGYRLYDRQEFFTVRFHFIVLMTLCLSWSSVEATDYKSGLKSQIVHVPGLPDRNQLPSLEGRGELSVAL